MYSLAILPPFINGLLTALLALLIGLAAEQELVTEQMEFACITLLLTIYLLMEISRVRAVQQDRWLVNPVVICSFFTFFLPFGLNNLLAILPVDWVLLKEILPTVTPSVNKLMFLVLTGAIAIWLGYWSFTANQFANKLRKSIFLSQVLRREISPRYDRLFIVILIGLVSNIVAIYLGIYGISSDPGQLERLTSVSQYLFLAQGLDELALIVVALHYFSSKRKERQTSVCFYGLFGYLVAVGFLSGFKFQVVIPFLIVGVCQYLNTSRIPWKTLVLVPFALFAAYMVIEPFRSVRFDSSSFDSRSTTSIINTFMQSMVSDNSDISIKSHSAQTIVGTTMLSRISLTEVAAEGIDYADKGITRDNTPKFLEPLLLFPLYAIVPKLLWESKQDTIHGRWYYLEVLGGADFSNTSAAMGPVTFLYFAGGWLAVTFGFLLLGGILRIIHEVFFKNNLQGALLVYVVALSQVIQLESVFYGMLINFMRQVPIVLFLQYILLKPTLPKVIDQHSS